MSGALIIKSFPNGSPPHSFIFVYFGYNRTENTWTTSRLPWAGSAAPAAGKRIPASVEIVSFAGIRGVITILASNVDLDKERNATLGQTTSINGSQKHMNEDAHGPRASG
ncbi:hypothetical protein DM02DRAFT_729033 [Periconia macrospinosa]|uniref:Uncharacterized protein n=1 Tax=Periconia macrospinosa TaxID=97972 RepID=A0A2V1DQS6_9PLEO|nr:hypothetical protein DM02DRAFT_729033 [Periconia macrospinosa]